MPPRRHVQKIASRIKFLVSHVLTRELNDPRIGFVTVIAVEPTVDLREAKITVSILGSEGEVSKAFHALEDASGYVQRLVGKNLALRHTPRLRFVLDDRTDHQARVEAILERTRLEDAAAANPDDDDSDDAENSSSDEEGPTDGDESGVETSDFDADSGPLSP